MTDILQRTSGICFLCGHLVLAKNAGPKAGGYSMIGNNAIWEHDSCASRETFPLMRMYLSIFPADNDHGVR